MSSKRGGAEEDWLNLRTVCVLAFSEESRAIVY